MQAAGASYVQQFAAGFGFAADLNPPILPLALGAGAVTPLQLAQAYAVFANGGERTAPRLITKISQRSGGVLYEAPAAAPRARVISERNAHVMDSMLRDVVRHGTGRRAAVLERSDVAGKTGTSNGAKDVWFAGYSSGVSTVVWMGYDQPRGLGRSTGGTLALPVWADYMSHAIANRPETQRVAPPGLAMLQGDYVYQEYLGDRCVEDHHAFIQSPLRCFVADAAQQSGRNQLSSPLGSGANKPAMPPGLS